MMLVNFILCCIIGYFGRFVWDALRHRKKHNIKCTFFQALVIEHQIRKMDYKDMNTRRKQRKEEAKKVAEYIKDKEDNHS